MTTRQVRAGSAYVELSTRDSKLIKGLQRAAKRLKTFGASAKAAGMSLLRTSGLAAIPFALSAKAFANFEQQMARVKALTGASGEEFMKLEMLAKKMGATTVFSASQAAEAMSYFALAGFDTQQIMDALGPTLNLAAAGQIEIAEAADIAAKIMSGMGIQANDLGNAIDVMAKAMTTANTDLTMLGDAFKFVGPMAKTAGVSLEEITAAIQLLSNAGIQGEMAGTTLRGMLLSLTSPSSEAARELDRLGVQVNDQQGNVRGLANIIGDLESSLSGVGSGEKLRVLGTIFPARQAAGAAELISQGATRLRDATAALGEASGTASKIAGTQLNTLQGDFMILLSALEGVGIAIGEALASSLRTAVQGVTGLLAAFGEWVTANKKVILTVAMIVAAVGLLGGGLVGLGIAFQVTAFGFAGLAAAMGLAMGLIGAILSPLGLLIVAAIALGTYLVYSSEVGAQALAWLADKFSSLKTDAIQSWDAISAALASGNWALAAKVLWLTLKMEWQRGVNYLTGLWLDAKHAMLNVWTSLKHGMIGVWLSIEKAIFQGINRLVLGFQKFQIGLAHTGRNFGEWIYKQSQLAEVAMQEINGTLTADQAQQRRSEIGRNYQAGLHSVSNQGQQENQAIDTQFAQQEAQLNADYEAMNRANVSEFASERNQANQQYAADMARSQSAVDQARREWEAAATAAKNPVPAAADDPSGSNGPPSVSVPAIESALISSRSALANEQKQIESKGGFNAFGLGGIAADSFSQRTANASEEIAVNTKALADQAKRGRLVFTD